MKMRLFSLIFIMNGLRVLFGSHVCLLLFLLSYFEKTKQKQKKKQQMKLCQFVARSLEICSEVIWLI